MASNAGTRNDRLRVSFRVEIGLCIGCAAVSASKVVLLRGNGFETPTEYLLVLVPSKRKKCYTHRSFSRVHIPRTTFGHSR